MVRNPWLRWEIGSSIESVQYTLSVLDDCVYCGRPKSRTPDKPKYCQGKGSHTIEGSLRHQHLCTWSTWSLPSICRLRAETLIEYFLVTRIELKSPTEDRKQNDYTIEKAIFYKSLKRRHSMVSVVFRFSKTSKYLQLRWALLGPKTCLIGPQKYLPIENTLWARGRDWVRFEIVRVSDLIKLFDQLRFVWPCPDSKEENWRGLEWS